MIYYHQEDTQFQPKQKLALRKWIYAVVAKEEKNIENVTYIFCSDENLLQMNKQHLKHDYYTDIITFDYSNECEIAGDLFISVDRVKDNATNFSKSFYDELHRVMIHGVLHLLGYKDKTANEKLLMRKKEDYYLTLRPESGLNADCFL